MSIESNPIRRYLKNPTRKNAIHAMCAHCVGCDSNHQEPGFRQSISACTVKACPLYRYRPFVDSGTLERQKNRSVENE